MAKLEFTPGAVPSSPRKRCLAPPAGHPTDPTPPAQPPTTNNHNRHELTQLRRSLRDPARIQQHQHHTIRNALAPETVLTMPTMAT